MAEANCQDCSELKKQLDEALREQKQELATKKQLEGQLASLTKEMRPLKRDLVECQSDLQETRVELDRLEALKAQRAERMQEVKRLSELCESTQAKVDSLIHERPHTLMHRLEVRKSDLERTKATTNARTRERDYFRGKCKESQDTLDAANRRVQEAENEFKKMTLEFESALKCKEHQIESLENINKVLTEKIRDLKGQLGIPDSDPEPRQPPPPPPPPPSESS